MVRELLAVGADTNVSDLNADTPLFVAVKERHTAAATELIAGGQADVRRRDVARARQPLHYAAELGLVDVAGALLDAGSDVNAVDGDGRTALMLATIGEHEAVAEMLIAKERCDVNVVDSTQRTCLFYAAQCGLVDTVRRLLQVSHEHTHLSAYSYGYFHSVSLQCGRLAMLTTVTCEKYVVRLFQLDESRT